MEEPIIEIQLLGKFAITRGERRLGETHGRVNKVWVLIEYLLAQRGTTISQERMIEVLWGDEECGNPIGALKNLVYRARRLLRELDRPGEETTYIVFQRNTYAWNPALPCVVDVEEMSRLFKQAIQKDCPIEERIRGYTRVVELYQGDFLPKSSDLDWVVVKNAYYATMFTDCVMGLVHLMTQRKHYEEIIRLCEYALVYFPFEEDFHRALLAEYGQVGRYEKAVAHYQRISHQFFEELGVTLTAETTAVYKEIIRHMHNIELSLSAIQDDLREVYERPGAFLCDYDIFKNIYRLEARSMQRTGYSFHIVLITFSDSEGNPPPTEVMRKVMKEFQEIVANNLRRGDVIAPYSATQLVVMLPGTTLDNSHRVVKRLLSLYQKENSASDIRVSIRIATVGPEDVPPRPY